jgi:hypothetical protein
MATQRDVQRIALSLPGTVQATNDFAFSVKNGTRQKGFAWVWKERVDPKKPRVPNPDVLAVRVADLDEKELLLATCAGWLFTEPHYHGFPAVLVRLKKVRLAELKRLLTGAWQCQAPKPRALRRR